MKIEELKDGDMVMQCIETGAKSTYTPPVRRREFVVMVSTDGIKIKDDEGNLSVPDFTEGRWYLEKVRDWTPDEMRSLVGRQQSTENLPKSTIFQQNLLLIES